MGVVSLGWFYEVVLVMPFEGGISLFFFLLFDIAAFAYYIVTFWLP
jgi:hypothetical protein